MCAFLKTPLLPELDDERDVLLLLLLLLQVPLLLLLLLFVAPMRGSILLGCWTANLGGTRTGPEHLEAIVTIGATKAIKSNMMTLTKGRFLRVRYQNQNGYGCIFFVTAVKFLELLLEVEHSLLLFCCLLGNNTSLDHR